MASLIEFAVKAVADWPDGVRYIWRLSGGPVCRYPGDESPPVSILLHPEFEKVKHEQWESARAAYLKTIATGEHPGAIPAPKECEMQAQLAQGAIKTDQEVWDEAAIAAINALTTALPGEIKGLDWKRKVVLAAHEIADIHMTERAKRLSAPAKPDTTTDLLAALEEAGHALNRWGPAAGERYLRMVQEAKEGGAA